MAILIRPGKRFRKARAGNGAEILKKLEDYLKTASSEPVELLCGFWKDQSNAITYQELRQAVLDGELDEKTADEWMQDYSFLVQGKLNGMWQNAIIAGSTSQPIIQALADTDYIFSTKQVLGWIQERGAELVTQCTDTQKEAIKVFLERTVRERHSVDELAKMIRPCIGLTKPQAQANLKYFEIMVKTCASNSSLTHTVVSGFSEILERLTNTQMIAAEKKGCIVLSYSSAKQVWIDNAINTLITPADNQDDGWKKIRRVKTRFELIRRMNAAADALVGKVDNDKDGRSTVVSQLQAIGDNMIAEGKLTAITVSESAVNVADGDSAWFDIDVVDKDSMEHIYLSYRFQFSTNA